ncbi:MAG: hypothetical protein JW993_01505 [Sedimentisphaerales bacterium]|nr:hypothetical protein [Sedimentisphaerales bacterium]
MRELLGKIGRFCESHVEKIVLILVAPVCAYFFFTGVIFRPNAVTYDGKTLDPGRIDAYVSEKADELRNALANVSQDERPKKQPPSLVRGPIEPNNPVVANVFASRPAPESFMSLFEDPLSFLDPGVVPVRLDRSIDGRRYALPLIGPVTDVAVNHIRAAAYVPVGDVSSTMGYSQTQTEPNDLDLVTVEAKFDVVELYRQFRAYFAGTEVEKREWRDPCLAVPKFAAVQLQRQRQLDDGTWSDWQAVPRSRIEQFRELFTPIERVQDLPPGGVKVRLMQFNSKPVTMALLQPEAYQIASAEEEWFPPSFYDKFKTLQRKVEMEQKRQEREERQSQQESTTTTTGRRGGTTTGVGDTRTTTRDRRGGGAYGDTGAYGGDRRGGARDRSGRTGTTTDPRTGTRRGTTRGAAGTNTDPYGTPGGRPGEGGLMREVVSTDEAYLDFAEALIRLNTDLSKLDEPLLFWAFDDTADPGQTYRYRIRLGVFNPVAGTNELVERDMDKNDQAILWSRFSEVTRAVSIPRRTYFFAKGVEERARVATVEVARYALGYWYTQDFDVRPGEVIGREMEPPKKKKETDDRMSRLGDRITPTAGRAAALLDPRAMDYQVTEPEDPTTPEMVDYGTGAMLVDLVEAGDLGSPPNLQLRPYHEMLYTSDGATIERMPVSQRNWPSDLQQAYQQIMGERNKDHQPFRSFTARSRIGMGDGRGGGGPYGPY